MTRALVVYESVFGDARTIAHAIADGLSASIATDVLAATEAPTEIGQASGVNSTMRELGGVFGIAVSVTAFGAHGGYASPQSFTDGFVAAMTVATILSLLAAAVGALLPRRAGAPATLEPATDAGRA